MSSRAACILYNIRCPLRHADADMYKAGHMNIRASWRSRSQGTQDLPCLRSGSSSTPPPPCGGASNVRPSPIIIGVIVECRVVSCGLVRCGAIEGVVEEPRGSNAQTRDESDATRQIVMHRRTRERRRRGLPTLWPAPQLQCRIVLAHTAGCGAASGLYRTGTDKGTASRTLSLCSGGREGFISQRYDRERGCGRTQGSRGPMRPYQTQTQT